MTLKYYIVSNRNAFIELIISYSLKITPKLVKLKNFYQESKDIMKSENYFAFV